MGRRCVCVHLVIVFAFWSVSQLPLQLPERGLCPIEFAAGPGAVSARHCVARPRLRHIGRGVHPRLVLAVEVITPFICLPGVGCGLVASSEPAPHACTPPPPKARCAQGPRGEIKPGLGKQHGVSKRGVFAVCSLHGVAIESGGCMSCWRAAALDLWWWVAGRACGGAIVPARMCLTTPLVTPAPCVY